MQISQAAYHRVTVGAVQSGAIQEGSSGTQVRRAGTDRHGREDVHAPEAEESVLSLHHSEKVDGPSRTRRGQGQQTRDDSTGGKVVGGESPTPQATTVPGGSGEDSYLNPTLRAALADNSRELQVRFQSEQGAVANKPPEPGSRGATRQMLDRLVKMTRDRIAQYVGDEPYSKGDYRALQDALENIRGQYDRDLGSQRKAEPEDPWEAAPRREGPALDAGMDQAGEVLSWFNPEPDPEPELALDLVA